MLGHRKLEPADYFQILRRRKWLIAIPLVVFPIAALVLCSFLPPKYTSQTLILIDRQKIPDDYVKPIVSSDLDSRLASMKEQILSRSRLQPIIEKYNLFGNEHMSMDDRIDAARKSIDIKAIHSEITGAGGLPGFFISFTASDPHTAQLACGEVTSLFLNENLRRREASAEGTSDFIEAQLSDAKRALDDQDAKLAAFQSEHFGKLPGEEQSNLSMLTSLNTQLEAANQAISKMEQDRTYMQTMLSQVTSGSLTSGSSSSVIPPVPNAQRAAKEAELQTLQNQETDEATHYTADYPDLIALRRRIAGLKQQIAAMPATVPAGSTSAGASGVSPLAIQQLRAQIKAADQAIASKAREQAGLQQSVRTYQERIQSSPEVAAQFKQLTRDSDTAKTFYDGLLAKKNDANMAADLERKQQGEQFSVMDKPNLPDAPTFPKKGYFLGGGLALGLAFGLALTAFLEYRNTALRTEQDIWAFTKLPTLGTITLTEPTMDVPDKKKERRWRKGKGSGKSALANAQA